MEYVRTPHYLHACINNPYGKHRDRPIGIIGSSGSGKSITAYNFAEELFESNDKYNVLFLYDPNDEYENCFPLLKATHPEHLETLKFQKEETETKPVKIHACFYADGIRREMKLAKKRYGDCKLPKIDNFFLIDSKSFNRTVGEFLMESSTDKDSINLLSNSSYDLSDSEGIYELYDKIKENIERKQTIKYNTLIYEKEPLGDRNDEKEIRIHLKMFEREKILVPKNFKVEVGGNIVKPFDIMDILNNRAYHSFILLFNEKSDNKHRMFFIDYIINEIDRHIKESRYPLLIVLDETDLLTPKEDSKGFNGVFAYHLSNKIEKWRKAGIGVTFLFIIHRYGNTDVRVRGACKERWFHKLEDSDMFFLKKVHSYHQPIIERIARLNVGDFIVEDEEKKMQLYQAFMPKHGHKHARMKFEVEYRKQYPEKLQDYTDLINKFEEEWKRYEDNYNEKEKSRREKLIQKAKRDFEAKMTKEKKSDELKEYKEKEKKQKIVDNEMRDISIKEVYNKMKLEGNKISYRLIAKELNRRNIKCSYGTVKNVLDKIST